MKKILVLFAAATAALIATPALADDGDVPRTTLESLGLGGLQPISETEGMQVRGRSSAFAMVMGINVIYGQLVTPDTKNFLLGSDANIVSGAAETTNGAGTILVTKEHASVAGLNLNVTLPDGSQFVGSLGGIVGGNGFAFGNP